MPDRAYMLPEDWEAYVQERDEREAAAVTAFQKDHPEHADSAITNQQAQIMYEFHNFIGVAGAVSVTRKSDKAKGYLYWADNYPSRVYFGFRVTEEGPKQDSTYPF